MARPSSRRRLFIRTNFLQPSTPSPFYSSFFGAGAYTASDNALRLKSGLATQTTLSGEHSIVLMVATDNVCVAWERNITQWEIARGR